MRRGRWWHLVTLVAVLAPLAGCLRTSTLQLPHPSPGDDVALLGLLDVDVRFVEPLGVDAQRIGTVSAAEVYVGPPRDPDTVALLSAATPVTSRTDFQVISAERVTAGDLTYITLRVEVTNKTGSDLTNLSILGYSSTVVSFSDGAVTRYVQQGTGSNATGAARVTPFPFATTGNPRASIWGATLGTTFLSENDAAFVGLAASLRAHPYDGIVAELFPYGFVANPEGDRTIANDVVATFYLSFKVLANTTELSWRGVIVRDPVIRLGLPAEVVGEENNAAYLQRLVNLSVSNSDAPVRGVVIGNVDDQPGQRVVEVRNNSFDPLLVGLRDAFVARQYRVDAIADVKLSVGSANSNYWLEAPLATATDVYLLERFTDPGSHTFVAPVSGSDFVLVEYLVVGGGGGGGFGAFGGGGGAGGLLTNVGGAGLAVTAQAYEVTVGAGGAAATSRETEGSNGSDSVFSTVTSLGGGGAGSRNNPGGLTGGSGGGGSRMDGAAGSGTAGQGNNGGTGSQSGGGGGGASQAGGNGSNANVPYPNTEGFGGAGTASSISGTSTTYAGGGGAGGGASSGAGGVGGGGVGGTSTTYTGSGNAAGNGVANTGGGGGGGSETPGPNPAPGGDGGSGIVLIRYSLAQP